MLPVRSHAPAAHVPRWHVSRLPQVSPSVTRKHALVSVEVKEEQAPLPHSGVVTLRVRIPESSHALVKPPQALQGLTLVLPQAAPSVFRAHTRNSLPITDSQRPPAQLGVATLRL